jgi:hypothetical protein
MSANRRPTVWECSRVELPDQDRISSGPADNPFCLLREVLYNIKAFAFVRESNVHHPTVWSAARIYLLWRAAWSG